MSRQLMDRCVKYFMANDWLKYSSLILLIAYVFMLLGSIGQGEQKCGKGKHYVQPFDDSKAECVSNKRHCSKYNGINCEECKYSDYKLIEDTVNGNFCEKEHDEYIVYGVVTVVIIQLIYAVDKWSGMRQETIETEETKAKRERKLTQDSLEQFSALMTSPSKKSIT